MLIDSHHHLWEYSKEEYPWISDQMALLRKNFLSAELNGVAAQCGVDGFITVQARQSLAETSALIQIACQNPRILGVVGWVPLADPNVADHLADLAQAPQLKGVRHVVQDEPDDRFLLGADFNAGVERLVEFGLVYDILIYARQLPAAIEFADRHPNIPMVLDHIAKPTIDRQSFDDVWEKNFRELAKRTHVTCKFSGVATEIHNPCSSDASADWSSDDIRRYWDIALDSFTPARLMFGSDWPVCLLRTSYSRWLDTVVDFASELTSAEQNQLFAKTAIDTYKLPVAS
jgi:L-fuconolactonase